MKTAFILILFSHLLNKFLEQQHKLLKIVITNYFSTAI